MPTKIIITHISCLCDTLFSCSSAALYLACSVIDESHIILIFCIIKYCWKIIDCQYLLILYQIRVQLFPNFYLQVFKFIITNFFSCHTVDDLK